MNSESVQTYLTAKHKGETMFTQEQVDSRVKQAVRQAMSEYQEELSDGVRRYAVKHNLCPEGVQTFCNEFGLRYNRRYRGVICIVANSGEWDCVDESEATEVITENDLQAAIKAVERIGFSVMMDYTEVQDVEEV